MNYLAHLYLSDRTSELLAGALLGDFVKGRLERWALPDGLLAGIRLHRRIDSYVDAHPAFRASRERISPPRRRYAGILVDVFYDHVLARDWECHAAGPLAPFCRRAYAAFSTHAAHFPPLARRISAAMAEGDWLAGYGRIEGIERSLQGIDRRLRRPGPLAGAGEELRRDYAGFGADFAALLPDLAHFAARELRRLAPVPDGAGPAFGAVA